MVRLSPNEESELSKLLGEVRTEPLGSIEEETTLRMKERRADNRLKQHYGYVLLGILAVQIGVADWFFYEYAVKGVQWAFSTQVIEAWLTATVVEVIGMTLVVTQHLFPRRDEPRRD